MRGVRAWMRLARRARGSVGRRRPNARRRLARAHGLRQRQAIERALLLQGAINAVVVGFPFEAKMAKQALKSGPVLFAHGQARTGGLQDLKSALKKPHAQSGAIFKARGDAQAAQLLFHAVVLDDRGAGHQDVAPFEQQRARQVLQDRLHFVAPPVREPGIQRTQRHQGVTRLARLLSREDRVRGNGFCVHKGLAGDWHENPEKKEPWRVLRLFRGKSLFSSFLENRESRAQSCATVTNAGPAGHSRAFFLRAERSAAHRAREGARRQIRLAERAGDAAGLCAPPSDATPGTPGSALWEATGALEAMTAF